MIPQAKILDVFKATAFFDIALIILLAIFSCNKGNVKNVSLEPSDKRTLYALTVEDPEEALLLEQEMKLDVLRLQDKNLYFYSPTEGVLDTLQHVGYKIIRAIAQEQEFRIVKINKNISEEELSRLGVLLITKEKNYFIVRGNLSQLKQLKEKVGRLESFTDELRPREIFITVNKTEDVQAISELGVDIYSTGKKDNGYLVSGGAFDYQIDELRRRNYTFTIKV